MSLNIIIWFLGIVYVLSCLWLVLVVLLQEGKSGGMGGAEAGGQAPGALTETFGAGGAQRGLFKMTSWTAAIFLALALLLTILGSRKEQSGGALDLGGESPAAQTEGTLAEDAVPAADEPIAPLPDDVTEE